MKNVCYLFASMLLCAASVGCQKSGQTSGQSASPSQPEAGAKRVIGLSVLTLTNPFFKEIADALSDEASKNGYEVLVVSGELDVAKQQNQVKDFIVKKVAAIVLTPCDSKSIGPVIQEANAAGIPVFTADIACIAPEAKVVSHIATDNFAGGKQAAEALFEAVGGQGKVAILDHPEVESAMLRTKGFQEKLAELNKSQGKNVEVVAVLPGLGARDKGFKVTQDLLQSHADLAGIFAVNDPSALGAVAALENAGKAAQVKVVGFDGQPEGKKAIRDGKIYADPIQFPDRIGRQTLQTILRYFEGEQVEKELLIPTALYRKADAEKDTSLK
jgi:ribose transport system substrate-binding protein